LLCKYDRKCAHKRALKKRHAVLWQRYDPAADEAKSCADYVELMSSYPHARHVDPRNGGYTYWETFYLSGPRKFAKRCTNRKIRGTFRELIANADPEDVPTLRGSDYEKLFDYFWTIY